MSTRGINKVILIGNVGKDPDIRYTPTGSAVCSFSIATSESWKDKDGKEHNETDWHNIVVWGKLAEICGQYLTKGAKVYIEGKLKTRSWDNKDGVKQYKTEIVANEMQMLDGKGGSGSAQHVTPQQPVTSQPNAGANPTEDDIPF